jgi:TolA-binding protein
MDAVTYPHEQVSQFLKENFIPVKLNTKEESDALNEATRLYAPIWTPTLLVIDHDKRVARRIEGFLPPEEFLPEMLLAQGTLLLRKNLYADAYALFQKVLTDYPNSLAIPEALYWAGVSAYRRDNAPDGLLKHWNELGERFPHSTWWQRASFIRK